jgi:hypothetical protein
VKSKHDETVRHRHRRLIGTIILIEIEIETER